MNLLSGHTVPGRKTANLVEVVQGQVNQFEETHRVVDIPSICQPLLEGYLVRSGELFADCETEARSGRVMTILSNESAWCRKLPE